MRAWLVVLMTVACTTPIPAPQADSAPPQGALEIDPVAVDVKRTRSASVESLDGDVKVTIPALSVEKQTQLVLARLREDVVGNVPHLGPAYVLRVTVGALSAPARVEWRIGPSTTVATRDLRIATLGMDGNLMLLRGAQATTDSVAAEVDGAATLLLVEKTSGAGELPLQSAGDALLWRADVEGARAAYNTARQQGPNPAAALGRAISDLLLLTQKPPVSDVLLRCGLAQDALLTSLVGPGGVLAQAAEDRAGDFEMTLADVSGSTTLPGDEVYARRIAGKTVVTARGEGFELRITLPTGDIVLGQRLTRTQLPAEMELVHGGDRFSWRAESGGTVTVFQRGASTGGRVQLELSGVVLTGAPGSVTIERATLEDSVSAPPAVVDSLGVSASMGPPLMPVVSRILGQCSADVTLSWLVSGASSLSEKLAPVATDLAEAAGAAGSAPLLMLPPGLTRLPRSIPVTARDARLLGAAVGVLRAGLAALNSYDYAGLGMDGIPHPVSAWLNDDGTLADWAMDGTISMTPAVVLDDGMLSSELNAQLLTPRAAGAMLQAGLRAAFVFLEGGLGDLRAAMKDTRSTDGMVRWSLLDASGFSHRVDEVAGAAASSMIEGTGAVPVGGGVSFNISKLVQTPLTHDGLVLRNGNNPLTIAFAGAPAGRTPEARNGQVLVNDHGVVDALWESFLEFDAPRGMAECNPAEQDACGAGFECVPAAVGVCAGGGGQCAGDDGCPAQDSCSRAHHCRRETPRVLDVQATEALWNGPQAPALGGWLWHLWQPVLGMDAARAALPGR